MSLILCVDHFQAITQQVIAAFPAEACGLMSGAVQGRDSVVGRLWPAANVAPSAGNRFELDPAVRFQAERACRGSDQLIIGHWHSHPSGRARPSKTDLAQAYEPHLIWLILAVDPTGVIDARAWRMDPGQDAARPVVLKVVDQASPQPEKACIPPGHPT